MGFLRECLEQMRAVRGTDDDDDARGSCRDATSGDAPAPAPGRGASADGPMPPDAPEEDGAMRSGAGAAGR